MDIAYKLSRLLRWGTAFGFMEALRFEVEWSRRRNPALVRVPGYPQPLQLRRWASDMSVFETVFLKREFDLPFLRQPQLIIDGGANVGYSTAYFGKSFPNAKVVAIEPSSENVAILRTNCGEFKNVDVIEGGLWPESGYLRIVNPNDPAWSFRCEPTRQGAEGAFPAYSIDDVMRRSGMERCSLLKLDVEGAEEQLFSRPGDWLGRVDAILVEVHSEAALLAVQGACPETAWQTSEFGEKLLLRTRTAPHNRGEANDAASH
ncbi:MAG: FkbM family methyltransferase [Burkholderiales bacterium]